MGIENGNGNGIMDCLLSFSNRPPGGFPQGRAKLPDQQAAALLRTAKEAQAALNFMSATNQLPIGLNSRLPGPPTKLISDFMKANPNLRGQTDAQIKGKLKAFLEQTKSQEHQQLSAAGVA